MAPEYFPGFGMMNMNAALNSEGGIMEDK